MGASEPYIVDILLLLNVTGLPVGRTEQKTTVREVGAKLSSPPSRPAPLVEVAPISAGGPS